MIFDKIRDWWSDRLIRALIIVAAVGVVALAAVATFTVRHPCLETAERHSDWTIIGYDSKLRPVYGPGVETTCVRREGVE